MFVFQPHPKQYKNLDPEYGTLIILNIFGPTKAHKVKLIRKTKALKQ